MAFGHEPGCPYQAVQHIKLKLIVCNTHNWSARGQQRINTMALSLQRNGQLQPITVEDLGDGTFNVIDGIIRVMACRRLFKDKVLCHVV